MKFVQQKRLPRKIYEIFHDTPDELFSAKKAAKKDDFEHAAGHLVFAIGGDLDK